MSCDAYLLHLLNYPRKLNDFLRSWQIKNRFFNFQQATSVLLKNRMELRRFLGAEG